MKLNDAISEFMLDQRIRGNSAATLAYYELTLRQFSEFAGNVDVSELQLQLCRDYYIKLAESDINSISVQSYIRGLRAFLRWLYDNEFIRVNICEKFKLPKATKKVIDVLTDSEIRRLFAALEGDGWLAVRNSLIIALMLDSGLRRHEVISLTVASVHLADRYIIVQEAKGDKQRVVPFGNRTATLLEEYFKLVSFPGKQSALILKEYSPGVPGEAATHATLGQLFRRLKESSGIRRLYPHLLRHTFATRYLENGGNIYSLQSILGHTSLEMVKRYLHLANTRICWDFPNFSPLDNLKK